METGALYYELQVRELLGRGQDAEREALYSLALRCLGGRVGEAAASGFGRLPVNGLSGGPGHGWLGRLFGRLHRGGGVDADTD
jgi:hypothetical protein